MVSNHLTNLLQIHGITKSAVATHAAFNLFWNKIGSFLQQSATYQESKMPLFLRSTIVCLHAGLWSVNHFATLCANKCSPKKYWLWKVSSGVVSSVEMDKATISAKWQSSQRASIPFVQATTLKELKHNFFPELSTQGLKAFPFSFKILLNQLLKNTISSK